MYIYTYYDTSVYVCKYPKFHGSFLAFKHIECLQARIPSLELRPTSDKFVDKPTNTRITVAMA